MNYRFPAGPETLHAWAGRTTQEAKDKYEVEVETVFLTDEERAEGVRLCNFPSGSIRKVKFDDPDRPWVYRFVDGR